MAFCVDTNVILRTSQQGHPQDSVALSALAKIVNSGDELCVFPQNIREFWNLATRPTSINGLGFSIPQVEAEISRLEAAFTILQDGLPVYREWRRLVSFHKVSGAAVHDCYIAAGMKVRKIERILTFKTSDFARYGITVIDPNAV